MKNTKNIKKNYKSIKKECNSCKANLTAWLSSLNYDKNKEEAMKDNFHNYCPVCIVSEKTRHKGRI